MTLPHHEPVSITADQKSALLNAMQAAANAAAEVTCRYFRHDMAVLNKADDQWFDPVTEADREAELRIREILFDCFPDIGFLGEEHESVTGNSGLMWVVDPIDGTRAFMSGMPLWGTLIALYDGQDAILGLMDQPVLDERFYGDGSSATLCSGSVAQPLKVRSRAALSDCIFYCTTPDMFQSPTDRRRFDGIRESVQLTRYGGDCYAYALLAMGHVDIVLDCDLKPYDIQALIPIIQGAGGVVSNWQGASAVDGGYVIAAGSAEIHKAALEVLQS